MNRAHVAAGRCKSNIDLEVLDASKKIGCIEVPILELDRWWMYSFRVEESKRDLPLLIVADIDITRDDALAHKAGSREESRNRQWLK